MTDRELFEKWAKLRGYSCTVREGEYINSATRMVDEAWQAATLIKNKPTRQITLIYNIKNDTETTIHISYTDEEVGLVAKTILTSELARLARENNELRTTLRKQVKVNDE